MTFLTLVSTVGICAGGYLVGYKRDLKRGYALSAVALIIFLYDQWPLF